MVQSLAVVVADIDVLVTECLAGILERHGHRVLVAVPTHTAVHDAVHAFGADTCIIDPALRDGQDLAPLERLSADFPATKVIVRTADTSSEAMQAALAAGVVGYLHKSRGPLVLLELLTRVSDGEVVVEGSFARSAPAADEAAADFRRMLGYLTPREHECLYMIAEGKGTAAMAAQLGVSTTTVRSHVQSVLSKLRVHSRLEAASLATRHQLSSPVRPGILPGRRMVSRAGVH